MTPAEFYSKVGSVFGYSTEYGPTFHAGQDYPWRAGTPIPSPGAGRVIAKGWSIDAGNYVTVKIGALYFIFYHLTRPTSLAIGDRIWFGAVVGDVGSTGKTRGAHLHLAVSSSPWPGQGIRQDPVPVVAALLAANGSTPASSGDQKTLDNNEEEEDDMTKNTGIYWDNAKGEAVVAILNTGSGYFQPFTGTGGGYNTAIATTFDTGSWVKVTESHAQSIERACAQVRARSDK